MKKVDVKVNNRKYSISFREEKPKKKSDPIVLGMNGKNEIRIMVTQDMDEDGEELVQHIKEAFEQYMKDMSVKAFQPKQFNDVLLLRKSLPFQEEMITIHIEENAIRFVLDEKEINVPYANILQLYAQHKMDMSHSHHDGNHMKYQFQYDIAIILECEEEEYALTSSTIETIFFALSQAYFMAQLKGARKHE